MPTFPERCQMKKSWRRMKGRKKVSSPRERCFVTTDLHILICLSQINHSKPRIFKNSPYKLGTALTNCITKVMPFLQQQCHFAITL